MSAGGHEEPSSRRATRQSVSVSQFGRGSKTCVFCKRLEKSLPNKIKTQKTSQMLTEPAETKLREAALLRNDQELLIAIGSVSSLIAREVHYHKLCYGDYTRKGAKSI